MPVLELALLQITTLSNSSSPKPLPEDAKSDLSYAMAVLTTSAATSAPFRLFQEAEDPTHVYISGIWHSIASHEAFLPSVENQQLISRLQGKAAIPWMFHIEVQPQPSVPTEGEAAGAGDETRALDQTARLAQETSALMDGSPVIAMGRHTVAAEQKADFEAAWNRGRGALETCAGKECIAGWRVGRVYGDEGSENEPQDAEYVVLSGWNSIQNHMDFGDSDAFKEYAGFTTYVKAVEVRHLKKVLP